MSTEIIMQGPPGSGPVMVTRLLESIRPSWQGRGLIDRVKRLLPVDPGSACQRLLNAAFQDLKEKILLAGVDIAKETAKTNKLPAIEKEEDILENYSSYNIIELSFRLGIISRAEYRRMQRCYEIRRDLEHEDNEYEAVLEDTFYIFKSTIEIVLSQDPIETIKLADIKNIINTPNTISVSQVILDNYEHAPTIRQAEIVRMLIGVATATSHPEIIKENAIRLLGSFREATREQVKIEVATVTNENLKNRSLEIRLANVLNVIGVLPYINKNKLQDIYKGILLEGQKTEDWEKQGNISSAFYDIGGFNYCPVEMEKDFVHLFANWWIGEPGNYGNYGRNRSVFYSNAAAPIIRKIFSESPRDLSGTLSDMRESKGFANKITNVHLLRRFENLVDMAIRI